MELKASKTRKTTQKRSKIPENQPHPPRIKESPTPFYLFLLHYPLWPFETLPDRFSFDNLTLSPPLDSSDPVRLEVGEMTNTRTG